MSPLSEGLIGQTISHYRIEALIGRGGMGVVYRAFDLRLDRPVALKFLPSLLHHDEEARGRFVAEARAASALDHPNICTIFEIGDMESGETFISMALYSGETLKEKIGRGPLAVDEALGYTAQIASGLSQAHEAGIVHRDMKPANVIVTSDGVAKILDFGLAKVEDQQLTRTGEIVGTLDYMSPEQVHGETTDPRSDVWSIGAMLFEMLTGRRPFKTGNQAAVLYSVLHDEPDDISVADPTILPEVAAIVRTCLQKDPAHRYSGAEELLTALERPDDPRAGGRKRSRHVGGGGLARTSGLRFGALGLAAAFAMVLLIPPARTWLLAQLRPDPALAHTLAAVIPSEGGAADDEILAEGLTHVLTGELARLGGASDSFSVLSATEMLNQEIRTAQRVYELYGANRVLMVSIDRLVGTPRVRVELVDPSNLGEVIGGATLPLPDSLRTAFQDSVPIVLADLLGMIPTLAAVEATRTDAKAFQYYAQGRGYLARDADPNSLEYATQLFGESLREDSLFAPAHAGLCEARFRQFQEDNDTSFVQAARASCSEAERLGSDQVEVLVPVASIYLQTGDADRALRMLSRAALAHPDNARVHHWLARADEELGRADEARDEFERAIELDPISPVYRSDFASHLSYNGQHAEAVEQWKDMIRLAPDNFFALIGLSGSYIFLDSLKQAEDLLGPLVARSVHARAFSNMGYLYLQEGRPEDAIEILERGLSAFPADIWLPRFLAQAQYTVGDAEGARRSWRHLIRVAEPLFMVDPSDEDALSALAEAHAALGDKDRARQYLNRLTAEPKLWPYNVYYLGRTLESLGDRETAIQQILNALRRHYPRVTVDRDPWLGDLRRDSSYIAKVEQTLGG